MLNENAKKLVAALRSGKYQQGMGLLAKDGKYCCLGVACELAVEEGLITSVVDADGATRYDDKRASLSVAVSNWLGLRHPYSYLHNEFGGFLKSQDVGEGVSTHSLAGLNDSGWTFEQIADFIESEPTGLFTEETVA